MTWFIILPLAALGIAAYRISDKSKKLACLNELLMASRYIKDSITLRLEPLGDIFLELSKRCPLSSELFGELEACARRGGELEKCIEAPKELSMPDGESRVLWCAFLSGLGREDYKTQVKRCAEFVKSFEERVEQKRSAMKKAAASEICLALCIGLFFAVLSL